MAEVSAHLFIAKIARMSEKDIESHLVKAVKRIGGKSIKMVPLHETGIPDRLVLHKGKAVFVELKAPGKKPRAIQVAYMKELNSHGFETLCLDNKSDIDKFVKQLIR